MCDPSNLAVPRLRLIETWLVRTTFTFEERETPLDPTFELSCELFQVTRIPKQQIETCKVKVDLRIARPPVFPAGQVVMTGTQDEISLSAESQRIPNL